MDSQKWEFCVSLILGKLSGHISNTNFWKVSFQVYSCCIRRDGTKKFHQTPRAINFPSILWWPLYSTWQLTHCVCHIQNTGYWKDEYIQNTQIGVGAGVHCVGHSIVKATVEDGGSVRGARHNRWLGKTLNPGHRWSVPPYPGCWWRWDKSMKFSESRIQIKRCNKFKDYAQLQI